MDTTVVLTLQDNIVSRVATEYYTTVASIVQDNRKPLYVECRLVAYHAMFKIPVTATGVARYFKKNHSTVLHASKTLNSLPETHHIKKLADEIYKAVIVKNEDDIFASTVCSRVNSLRLPKSTKKFIQCYLMMCVFACGVAPQEHVHMGYRILVTNDYIAGQIENFIAETGQLGTLYAFRKQVHRIPNLPR